MAVVGQDGSVKTDRSAGFRSDLIVVRVIGRFASGFLYPSAVARIKEFAEARASTSPPSEFLTECHI